MNKKPANKIHPKQLAFDSLGNAKECLRGSGNKTIRHLSAKRVVRGPGLAPVALAIYSTLFAYGCTIQKQTTINIKIMSRQKNAKQITILTKYNRHKHVTPGSSSELPSVTSQGEALSMAEIIRRYTRGDIPPLAEAAFHGRDLNINEMDGTRPMEDLTDAQQVQEELTSLRRKNNDRTSVARREAKKAKSEAAGSSSESPSFEETSAEGRSVSDEKQQ